MEGIPRWSDFTRGIYKICLKKVREKFSQHIR